MRSGARRLLRRAAPAPPSPAASPALAWLRAASSAPWCPPAAWPPAEQLLAELAHAPPPPPCAAAGCAAALRPFLLSRSVAAAALAARPALPAALLPRAVAALQRALLARCPPALAPVLAQCSGGGGGGPAAAAPPTPPDATDAAAAAALAAAEAALLPLFLLHTRALFGAEVAAAQPLLEAADLSPLRGGGGGWPPPRALVYHHGPTNSGKTHAALASLKASPSGVYLGPLRLLALEVCDTLNAAGVPCSLVTGQERREVAGARHLSCTVEMAPLSPPPAWGLPTPDWHCAVLDEAQLLADEARGWAWTRALYGLRAEQLHLCGDASALPLARYAAAARLDSLAEVAYARRAPLFAEAAPLGSLALAQPGDCVVAFSKAAIFAAKRAVEAGAGLRCAVVYGGLPPEARRKQAELFNSGGADVLVASDAVGLGLNLAVKRVVFTTLARREPRGMQQREQRALQPPPQPGAAAAAARGGGQGGRRASPPPPRQQPQQPLRGAEVPLPPSLVRQVAGRAGRAGGPFPGLGSACALHAADVPYLLQCLAAPVPASAAAGVLPTWEDNVAPFAAAFPADTLPQLLDRLGRSAHCGPSGGFFLCRTAELAAVAGLLEAVPGLAPATRFLLASAPVAAPAPAAPAGGAGAPAAAGAAVSASAAALLRYARAYAAGGAVALGLPPLPPPPGGASACRWRAHHHHPPAGGGGGGGGRHFPPPPGGPLLAALEARHAAASLYCWLAQRLGEAAFPEVAAAQAEALAACDALGGELTRGSDEALAVHAARRRGGGEGGGGAGGFEAAPAGAAAGAAGAPRRGWRERERERGVEPRAGRGAGAAVAAHG